MGTEKYDVEGRVARVGRSGSRTLVRGSRRTLIVHRVGSVQNPRQSLNGLFLPRRTYSTHRNSPEKLLYTDNDVGSLVYTHISVTRSNKSGG